LPIGLFASRICFEARANVYLLDVSKRDNAPPLIGGAFSPLLRWFAINDATTPTTKARRLPPKIRLRQLETLRAISPDFPMVNTKRGNKRLRAQFKTISPRMMSETIPIATQGGSDCPIDRRNATEAAINIATVEIRSRAPLALWSKIKNEYH
jgi:hypothetical protein